MGPCSPPAVRPSPDSTFTSFNSLKIQHPTSYISKPQAQQRYKSGEWNFQPKVNKRHATPHASQWWFGRPAGRSTTMWICWSTAGLVVLLLGMGCCCCWVLGFLTVGPPDIIERDTSGQEAIETETVLCQFCGRLLKLEHWNEEPIEDNQHLMEAVMEHQPVMEYQPKWAPSKVSCSTICPEKPDHQGTGHEDQDDCTLALPHGFHRHHSDLEIREYN